MSPKSHYQRFPLHQHFSAASSSRHRYFKILDLDLRRGTMIYYITHPDGPVVIRTSNPFIVMHHQKRGWCTATSLDDVLHNHPEWQPQEPLSNAKPSMLNCVARVMCQSFSSAFALIPAYSSAGTKFTASLLASQAEADDDHAEYQVDRLCQPQSEQVPDNYKSIHWMTALERQWYMDRGYKTPERAWEICTEDDTAFDFRLEFGEWEIDEVPAYEVAEYARWVGEH